MSGRGSSSGEFFSLANLTARSADRPTDATTRGHTRYPTDLFPGHLVSPLQSTRLNPRGCWLPSRNSLARARANGGSERTSHGVHHHITPTGNWLMFVCLLRSGITLTSSRCCFPRCVCVRVLSPIRPVSPRHATLIRKLARSLARGSSGATSRLRSIARVRPSVIRCLPERKRETETDRQSERGRAPIPRKIKRRSGSAG